MSNLLNSEILQDRMLSLPELINVWWEVDVLFPEDHGLQTIPVERVDQVEHAIDERTHGWS